MDDTDELIIRLCTHVGMVMGDASIVALTFGGLSLVERLAAIADLRIASETIECLVGPHACWLAKGVASRQLRGAGA
jgi:hypothetical protein